MAKNNNDIQLLIRQIRKYATERDFSRVLIALSGGADSVFLSRMLIFAGFNIIALHCNFHLRGDESNRDQRFVEEFCRSQKIPLEIKHFDLPAYINDNSGVSLEMACRKLRYDWFREFMEISGFDRIATGHNADDNTETFLLNMLRGCGSRGLKGMDNDNGKIWRPLLNLHRSSIIEFLKVLNQPFITDSSNLKSDFRRNFLRNDIIPLLKSRWPGFNKAMDTTIANIKSENQIIEDAVSQALPVSGQPLSVKIILNFPDPVLLIRRFIEDLNPFTTTPAEILAAIRAAKPHIRTWILPGGKAILRNKLLEKIYPLK